MKATYHFKIDDVKYLLFNIIVVVLLAISICTNYHHELRIRQTEENIYLYVHHAIRKLYPSLVRNLQDYDVLHSEVQFHNFVLKENFPEHVEEFDEYQDYFDKKRKDKNE